MSTRVLEGEVCVGTITEVTCSHMNIILCTEVVVVMVMGSHYNI